ncbi:hypothetical protein RHMOL_Rhmol07G0163400 [Rhododendron molle]|uniref:Uncharacterized protein n=1 Tax=Rhododendron molle TaxID=49168 RepID=A0ACC0N109_RHOML|nr:hypothetical protein RHMOL_Rhmol07G0163400 [Rhododendron molle]
MSTGFMVGDGSSTMVPRMKPEEPEDFPWKEMEKNGAKVDNQTASFGIRSPSNHDVFYHVKSDMALKGGDKALKGSLNMSTLISTF